MRNATCVGVIAAVAVLALQGCTKKKEEAPPPPVQEAPLDTIGTGSKPEPVTTPAQTVAELWPQIESKQAKLGAAIDENRMKSVGRLAFGVRDLVVVLAEKAGAESPEVAPRLPPMLDLVKASAARLDELASARDTTETQKEFSKLTSILAGMKAATTSRIP